MCGKDAYGQAIRWGQIRITQTTTTNNKQKQNSFYIMGTRGTTVFANFLSVDRRGREGNQLCGGGRGRLKEECLLRRTFQMECIERRVGYELERREREIEAGGGMKSRRSFRTGLVRQDLI